MSNELPNYDDWKLAEPLLARDKGGVINRCCVCGFDIYEWENYYDVGGDIVCDECDMDYMYKFRKVADQ